MQIGQPLRLADGAELLLERITTTHESDSMNRTFAAILVSRDGKRAYWPAGAPLNDDGSRHCYSYVMGLWIAVLAVNPSAQVNHAYVSVRVASPEDVEAHAPPCPCAAEVDPVAPDADRPVAPPWRTAPPSPSDVRRHAQVRGALQSAVARRRQALLACQPARDARVRLRLAFVDGAFVAPDPCDHPAQRTYDTCVLEALAGEPAPPLAGRHLVCYGGPDSTQAR
jgi:hypothetical protein